MKILITGAGGMLGTDLSKTFAPHLSTSGIDIAEKPHLGIPCRICDLADYKKTKAVLLDEKPDWIIHAAAMTQVDLCETRKEEALLSNLTATENLVQIANELGSPLIFFSTDYVFDGKKDGPYTEDDLPNPIGFYGETKLRAENYIRQFSKSFMIFRISWLFGEYGNSFPRTMLKIAEKEKVVKVVDDQTGRPTYTKDLACAIFELIHPSPEKALKNLNQVFHLTNEGATSWYEYAKFIFHVTGKDEIRVVPISSRELDRKARRPANSVLCLDKSEKQLGLKLRSWQKAVKDYLHSLNPKQDLTHEHL